VPVKNWLQKLHRAFPTQWEMRRDYRLYDERRPDLGPYYITWYANDDATTGEGWERRSFDADGVLLSTSRGYHPIDICQYGLQRHADWVRTGDGHARAGFLAQADWAASAQTNRGDIAGVYTFPYAWRRYACDAGFCSAMAQGEAISLLLRAFQETGNDRYRQRAVAAASSYLRTIEEGGVMWRGPDGAVIFEEAAATPASHILNGWIYALWGLFELHLVVDDPALKDLYEKSLVTLRTYLPYYSGRDWSYYNLLVCPSGFRKYATLKYHCFHIAQLSVLTSMTGDSYYANVASHWQSHLDSAASRRHVLANAFAAATISFTSGADTVPGGARSLV
jgi:heparosan-N-sulfate-glucuronate 5-epimerase